MAAAVSRAISIISFMVRSRSSGVSSSVRYMWSEMVHRHSARYPARAAVM